LFRSGTIAENAEEIVVVALVAPVVVSEVLVDQDRVENAVVHVPQGEIVHRANCAVHVRHAHRASVHRASSAVHVHLDQWVSVQCGLHVPIDQLPDLRYRIPVLQVRRLRHHLRRQARPRRVLPRASRGDLEPCYWHRHVLNIASNIAVA